MQRQREILATNPDLDVLDWLTDRWEFLSKNEVFAMQDDGTTYFNFAGETEGVRFLLGIGIGPKGGLSELAYVWDTSKKLPADQIVLADVTARGDGYFVSLIQARIMIRRGQDASKVCKDMVTATGEKLLKGKFHLLNVQRRDQSARMRYNPFAGQPARK